MICGNCGFQNEAGDEFCGSCGKFLEWEDQPEPSQPPPLQPLPPEPLPPEPLQAPPLQPLPREPSQPLPPNPTANLIRCAVCGTANELTRTFCQNCGSMLPKAGTVSRLEVMSGGGRTRPDWGASASDGGHPNWGLLLGAGAAVLVILLLVGVVVFGGFLNDPGVAGVSPTPSSIASGSPGPSPATGAPTASDGATPGGSPQVTATAAAPTESAGQPTSSPAPTTPAPSGAARFRCETQQVAAPEAGRWTVTSARWRRRNTFDLLAVTLRRGDDSTTPAAVNAFLVPVAEVTSRFGVPAPGSGDIALVLAFNESVALAGTFGGQPDYRALKEFQVSRNGAGQVHLVAGVGGAGCYNLVAGGWASGPNELVVEISR